MRSLYSHMVKGALVLSGALCMFVNGTSLVMAESVPQVSEQNPIDNIKYPEDRWGKLPLDILARGPAYLQDVAFNIEPPPANSSEITRNELTYLMELAKFSRDFGVEERIRTEDQAKRASEIFVAEGLIKQQGNEALFELLDVVYKDHGYVIMERKKHFARPRPMQLKKGLETVVENPMHAAYPSGHASQAYMVALILSEFDPERAELYKKFAIDIAHRREIAGVHYPSDSEAGRQLAVEVLDALKKNEDFMVHYMNVKSKFVAGVGSGKSEDNEADAQVH